MVGTGTLAPDPDTGSAEQDLTVLLEALYSVVEYPLRVKALRGLMAEAQLDWSTYSVPDLPIWKWM
ncbi:hypothetical protein ACQPXH_14845 [Nocardia sp. CA-135953]|uniref:hypothetical protein n=1 Tax=Nocardia sp. CA-135953 TaxID=3239978 RepID=UPI003D96D7F9